MKLAQLEDAEFYDATRARREPRPARWRCVQKTFGVKIQTVSPILIFSGLFSLSPVPCCCWSSGACRHFCRGQVADQALSSFAWRSPENAANMYRESVMAREDYTKEVKLFDLARSLPSRASLQGHGSGKAVTEDRCADDSAWLVAFGLVWSERRPLRAFAWVSGRR